MESNEHVVLDGQPEVPAPTYEDLAGMVGLPLVDGALTEEQVFAGCQQVNQLRAAEVMVRPADVDLSRNWVEESPSRLACLTGFPGGSSTTPARLYEARDVLRRGVKQLVVTMNLGKLVSRKFLYLESELLQLAESCRQNDARLRLLLEVESLQQDHVLIGVRLCKRTAVQGMDLWFRANNEEFVRGVAQYVLHHARQKLEVTVHVPSIALPAAMALRDAGVTRLVTPEAAALLDAWRQELDRRRQEAAAQQQAAAGLQVPPS